MDIIAQYYLMCTIRIGGKKHVINQVLADKNIAIVFPKKEVTLYLRQRDGAYIARENVVGGVQPAKGNIIVVGSW